MKNDLKPINVAEKIVWWFIANTYPIWLIGGLYVVGSFVGWILLLLLLIKVLAQTKETPPEEKITVSFSLWIWIAAMLLMEVALIAGHLDYNLDKDLMVKSTIGWAKGWAGLALYPLAGCLNIRPQIIYRAVCVVALHTLLIIPFLLLAPALHLPQILYVSPLKAVGETWGRIF